jgi:hypothetical protein
MPEAQRLPKVVADGAVPGGDMGSTEPRDSPPQGPNAAGAAARMARAATWGRRAMALIVIIALTTLVFIGLREATLAFVTGVLVVSCLVVCVVVVLVQRRALREIEQAESQFRELRRDLASRHGES